MSSISPKVFISYSHDNQTHKNWVLNLAGRLVGNGVDVLLDQWDLNLGSDLPKFMEHGLTAADRVIAVCSETYVNKANDMKGGVGYEKMILSAQLLSAIGSERIIPIVRNNASATSVPTFLSTKLYVDFRDDGLFEQAYTELLRDIHGVKVTPKPALGANPFLTTPSSVTPAVSFSPDRYKSFATSGTVTFDYSNNDGRYVIGTGDYSFETQWARGGNSSIYVLRDPPSIRSVALAVGVSEIVQIGDASVYDTSSRHRSPQLGEIVIWQNTAGYYLATKIEAISSRGHGRPADEVIFTYAIAPNKSASFI